METNSPSSLVSKLTSSAAASADCCVRASTVVTLFVHVLKSVTPTPMRKRKRELVSSYKRKQGQEFMESEKAPVDLGPWRVLETLCLIVCRDVLVINTIATTSTNLKDLNNYVA